ncbi:MAG: FAD/NAD(P)-binding protein [Candidatus Caldarchaeum sp.]|nr:FAD/NAD(P)-binding protein [Candidatus Caldarchaeum sp.]
MTVVQKLETIDGLNTFMLNWFKVVSKTKENPDTYTIGVRPRNNNMFSFIPGQFVMLYIYGVGEAPISISGKTPDDNTVFFTVRAVGPVTKAIVRKNIHDTIGVRGPFGVGWPLEEAVGHDVIVVAGGIGLAPLRQAIRHVIENREKYGQFFILYGARSPAELLYKTELKRWRSRLDTQLLVTVDRGDEKWRGHIGVVTTLFRNIRLDPKKTYALVCGPEIMMKYTVLELKNQGVPDHRIFLSMERNMKCGVGLCGHCQFGPHFVCKDGAVFRFSEISRFFDRREL